MHNYICVYICICEGVCVDSNLDVWINHCADLQISICWYVLKGSFVPGFVGSQLRRTAMGFGLTRYKYISIYIYIYEYIYIYAHTHIYMCVCVCVRVFVCVCVCTYLYRVNPFYLSQVRRTALGLARRCILIYVYKYIYVMANFRYWVCALIDLYI